RVSVARRSGEVLFFFQAEDGIRDFHVTGVQTCALPIWARVRVPDRAGGRAEADGDLLPGRARLLRSGPAARPAGHDRPGRAGARSEERRVGKEWRSRGAPRRVKKIRDGEATYTRAHATV